MKKSVLLSKESSVCMLSSPSTESTYHFVDVDEPTIAVLDECPRHDPVYTLSWSGVSYSVATKRGADTKPILRNVSGRCGPGEMMAIMGPSGSGKTTLLDILADRVGTGSIHGTIELNGTTRSEKTFRAVASYVAQDDSLLGSLSVVETLRMAAKLSLPSSITNAMIDERVHRVIGEMGLRSCQDTIVGDIFRKGLSGGQRLRLSIAIELLSNPSILLLDEPTSGLDSSATHNVIKLLSGLCRDHRKTVVFTIHQPSSLAYGMFSSILVLSSGQSVYCGPRDGAIAHFASAGYACPTYSNPAEYFIELVNDDFDGHADVPRLVQAYTESTLAKDLARRIADDRSVLGGSVSLASTTQLDYTDARMRSETSDDCPSAWRQFCVILYRCSLNNVRNPGIYWVRLCMYIMLSFMVGTMYLSTNADISEDDMVPLLFYVQAFLVFMSVAVLPFFIEQRSVFLRERTNAQLHVGSYVVANFIAAVPGIFLIALLSTLLVVLLAGLNSFGWFLLNLFLSLVVAESLMHVIGAAVPHYIIGIALGAGIFGMFMLCEGFMVPRASIPDYWIWGYYLAFHSYSFEAFVYNHFAYEDTPRAAEILKRLGMDKVDVPRDMAILAVYAVVLELIFAFILYKFHTGRR